MFKNFLLKEYLYKYKNLIIITFISNLLMFILGIVITYMTGKYIDSLISIKTLKDIYIFSLILLILGITNIFIGNINNYTSTKLQSNLVFDLNFDIIKYVKKLPINFFDNIDSVYLNQRINSDCNTIVNYFISLIIHSTVQVISLIIILIILKNKSIELFYLSIISMPIYVLMYMIFEKRLYRVSLEFKEKQNKFFSMMNKQLSNIPYIKLNSLFGVLNNELKNNYPIFLNSLLKYQKCNYYFSSVESILDNIFNIILFLYGGISIYNNKMSVGDFIIIQNYYLIILRGISNLTSILESYPDTKVSFDRVMEIFDEKVESNGEKMISGINSIELKNICMNFYDKNIINNFNYIFNKGFIYLIKGDNGSGKSTLVKLLLGLYIDEYKGKVTFNDIDIKDLNLYEIRKKYVSIIDQEPILIHDDLYKNIYQDLNIPIKTIDKMIDDMDINLKIKDKSLIDVSKLSGGEKQKISIISAILKNGDLLILDEPTSALDNKATQKLIDIIKKEKKEKIIIVISHDKRIDKICDKIINL